MQAVVYEGLKERRCPKCGMIGVVDELFGWRMSRGNVIPQSWCKGCRSKSGTVPAPIDDAIDVDLEQVRRIYAREYPRDRAGSSRSWRFCVGKLSRRGYRFANQKAREKWEEKSK